MQGIIQVAGIIDADEAQMLVEAGVDYLGFPFRLPVHKEDLTVEAASQIIRSLIPPHHGVLITYLNQADEIIELCAKLGTKIVQLHGNIIIEELNKLKELVPQLVIIKSLIVQRNNLVELEMDLHKYVHLVDMFITDTFDPSTGATGATGKPHDWGISRRLVELSEKPIILAGGLNPDNVAQAIQVVRPAGVDAHTGVEGSDGRKDRDKVKRFVTEAKKAFKTLNH
jgi:phosphoribosylanthranilate isomerase